MDATSGLGAAFTGLFLLLPASWCLSCLYLSRLGTCWVSCQRMEYPGTAHVILTRYLGKFPPCGEGLSCERTAVFVRCCVGA